MLDNLALAASSIFLVLGTVLLYRGISASGQSQNLTLFAGAALLALGLFTVGITLKNKWIWRQNYKKWRKG